MGKLHLENLKSITTSERGAELGRRSRGTPNPINAFKKRKYCNQKCYFFDHCPAITTSQTLPPDELGRHHCYIKTKSKEIQNYFMNLFQNGEEGLIKIVMDLHFRLLLETGHDPKARELRDAISITLDMIKNIYGDKQKVEHSGSLPIQIIIERPEHLEKHAQPEPVPMSTGSSQ